MGDLQLFELARGIQRLSETDVNRKERWSYYAGDNDALPFATEGLSDDYYELREQSPLPLIRLAIRTPMQRMRIRGMLTESDATSRELRRILKRNRFAKAQRVAYVHAAVYGLGLVAVWPNPADPTTPTVRVDDPNLTWIEQDGTDPSRIAWAAKAWSEQVVQDGRWVVQDRGVVYEPDFIYTYKRVSNSTAPVTTASTQTLLRQGAGWEQDRRVPNPFGRVPFAVYTADIDSEGIGGSMVKPLIPMQRAINTMRFDLLLAAQFAAYRQIAATGYDPVIRDGNGDPIWQTYPVGHEKAGEPVLDTETGQPLPLLRPPGRVGVDRLLAFPSPDTNVLTIPESNLENYVTGLLHLVGTFAATGQLPPSYLLGDFKNVSADLVTSTEATLRSLIVDLQTSFGSSHEDLAELIGIAANNPQLEADEKEAVWEPAGPLSLQQIADGASKLVPLGYDLRALVRGDIPPLSEAQAEALKIEKPAAPAAAPTDTPPSESTGQPGEPAATDGGTTDGAGDASAG